MEKPFQYIRRLIIALAISGLLNIAFACALLYWFFKEAPPPLYIEHAPIQTGIKTPSPLADKSNADLLCLFHTLSTSQLITRLSNRTLVENGYMQRDLALAALVAFHHFDLPRALLGLPNPTQSRSIAYGQGKDGTQLMITLYPQLSDAHFEAITHFAKTERWPMSAEGLFLALKSSSTDQDPSLLAAFQLTPEFLAFETLLSLPQVEIEKVDIVKLMLDGDWAVVKKFTTPLSLNYTGKERRQKLLETYLNQGSATAAKLLVKLEFSFTLKKLENTQILQILQLLEKQSSYAQIFARALLNNPRNDAVWNMATEITKHSETPSNLHPKTPRENAITHAVLQKSNPAIDILSPPLSKKERLYIVQEGDNLWKLSRRFGVSIELLRGHNQLKNEVLKPGFPLRIPPEPM